MTLPPSLEEKSAFKKSLNVTSMLRLVLALGIAFLVIQINLDSIESYLYDLRVKTKLITPSSEKIHLIYITPETVQKYKGLPSSVQQVKLLEKLVAAQPRAIVYDFGIEESPGTVDEKNLFEAALISQKDIYVAGKATVMKGEEKLLYFADPFEQVQATPAPKTSDQLNFAKDGVTRRMLLTYQDMPMLQLQLATLYNPEVADVNNVRGHFKFYDTDQAYIDFHKPGTFPSESFENLLDGDTSLEQFKDQIVIIGTDLNLQETEYVKTPYSREVTAMTRIELQANTIDTLIRNSGPTKAPPFLNWLLVGLISILTVYVALTLKPAQGLLILGSTIAGFTAVAFLAFWLFGFWMPMAHPLLAIFLCYYFFIPYRLIIENRRSWEYYQKNKLLSQVEELKTNFISMMSHDLKTPIARIQGMTDVILTDEVTLSSQQREAVDTIKHSADDLLKFINAILNYGRIESEGVRLNLQSKDLNNILTEVVRKHEFLAKVKRIQIVSELEPLFPIPVDSDLMRQVLSNLVENAIKYSPEDTKILVSSEEKENKVVIQVADQGQGIPADELANIFMKFFRSKNAKSSPIKGSGLGLYLAKYFTELHHGTIIVESSYGNGSTFTVELPMEQGGTHA
ncbi:Sensor protein SrrB [compost metagenome]